MAKEEVALVDPIPYGPDGNHILDDKVLADCFGALVMSIFDQWLLSSSSKMFIFQDMLNLLRRMGYEESEVERIHDMLKLAASRHNKESNFMG